MTSSTRRRLARLASLGARAAVLFPREAEAQELFGGAGVYTSFTFGSDYFGFGWGVEGLMSVVLEGGGSCDSGGRGGLGPTIQLGGINVDNFRLVAALQGGGSVGDDDSLPVIVGEAGLAMHANEDEVAAGIHTGLAVDVSFSPISSWMNFVRAEWLLNEYSVGGGVIMPGRFGLGANSCIIGRPLRDDLGVVPAGHVTGVEAARMDSAARAWAEDAQAEAASVPAFLCLAAELLHANAPVALVDRALDAAADEIRHARSCAEIASRLAGACVVPTVPAPPKRTRLHGDALFTRLAAESWLDGCLNEGAAAARAARAARLSRDPDARATQRRIAADEARHAELGWDVLAFALREGGDLASDVVRELRGEQISFAREVAAGDARWGQIERPRAEETNARVASAARRRLDGMLAASRPT